MKAVIVLLVAAVAAAAQPHAHFHGHRRDGNVAPADWDVVTVPGPVVTIYELDGRVISAEEVEEGIKNGTLKWAPGSDGESVPVAAATTSTPESAPSSADAPAAPSSSYVAPSSSDSAPTSASSTQDSAPSSAGSASYSSSSSSSSSSGSGSGGDLDFDQDYSTGIDEEFPDGELDCDTFPSAYGAVAVNWMGLGGWTGVQQPETVGDFFHNIKTAIFGQSCSENGFCSYACPAGYQKSQWPTTQGLTGQSVGGLLCQNGKLHLTNPGLSKTLCIPGAQQVTVLVQNKMSTNVPVCRTDYPGTESETVPLNVQPGQTVNLTCPDADNYYFWQNKATSAQYYVNPAGTSVSDACQWGTSDNPTGNFAPLNLGVGYSNGAAWLSIFQNYPTTSASLGFKVTVIGDSMSGTCTYSGGQYCSITGCNSGNGDGNGCTVSASTGTLTYVFEDA